MELPEVSTESEPITVEEKTIRIVNILSSIAIIISLLQVVYIINNVVRLANMAMVGLVLMINRYITTMPDEVDDPAKLHEIGRMTELGKQLEIYALNSIRGTRIEYESLKDPNSDSLKTPVHVLYFMKPDGWVDTEVLRTIKNDKMNPILAWYPESVEIRSLGTLRTNIRSNYYRSGVTGVLSTLNRLSKKNKVFGDLLGIKSKNKKEGNE